MSLLTFEKQGWHSPVLKELKGEGEGEGEFRHAREHEKEDIGTPARTLLFFSKPPSNRPFERWCHFTNMTRILYVFPFIFKFSDPSVD